MPLRNFAGDAKDHPETCQYRGYRYGPNEERAYELSEQYWIIFGARLVFVVLFEHFVFIVTELLSVIIPDVPYVVARQKQLEKMLKAKDGSQNEEDNDFSIKNDDYDNFLREIRGAKDHKKFEQVMEKNAWLRRISRRLSNLNLPFKSSTEDGPDITR